jgi:hypothetical protein
MAAAVLTGVVSGVQGARLARQAPNGAVPVETGTKPAPETPEKAARIQRSLGVLGSLNIVAGVALVAVNAVLAQVNHSHPAKKRVLALVLARTLEQPAVGRHGRHRRGRGARPDASASRLSRRGHVPPACPMTAPGTVEGERRAPLIRPPALHTGESRAASRLELFFDLAYVLVVAELATAFVSDPPGTARASSPPCS